MTFRFTVQLKLDLHEGIQMDNYEFGWEDVLSVCGVLSHLGKRCDTTCSTPSLVVPRHA